MFGARMQLVSIDTASCFNRLVTHFNISMFGHQTMYDAWCLVAKLFSFGQALRNNTYIKNVRENKNNSNNNILPRAFKLFSAGFGIHTLGLWEGPTHSGQVSVLGAPFPVYRENAE